MEPLARVAELEAENEVLRAHNGRMRAWIERATELIAVLGGQSTLDAIRARSMMRELIDDRRGS